MHKVKIFSEEREAILEAKVNDFIKTIALISIVGLGNSDGITSVMVIYKELE